MLKKVIFVLSILVLGIVINKLSVRYSQEREKTDDIGNNLEVIVYGISSCKYCHLAQDFLKTRNIGHEVIELGADADLQLKLQEKTGQTTVPYIYINGEFIGGYQDLMKLGDEGKL